MNIQITGASGAGKSFLGSKLAEILDVNFVDTDEILWVWGENIQPYTVPTTDEEACNLLKEILDNNKSTIASGLFYPWSESLINRFDLLIVLETNKEVRKRRIIRREYEMYGDRYKFGGDMYEQFNSFLNWAMDYDTSTDKLGSKKETDKWAQKFKCPVLYIDGSKLLKSKIDIILKEIEKINKEEKYDNSRKIKKG